MRVSLNWLKSFVDIPVGPDELAEVMTMLGLEIEAVHQPGKDIKNIVVGRVLSIDPHPDADKLVVCKTDVGGEQPLQIVCGAKNMKPGDYVPTAVVGATLPGGFEIGRRKMRGIESQGMMCSARELGLGDEHDGLLILEPGPKVGEDILPVLGLDDFIFEIEITPNRGDWAGMIGIARELAAHFNSAYRLPEVKLTETQPAAATLSSVTIEDSELCPRYIGRVIVDVRVGESPAWLKNRLIAAGQRPINNIVDITNLVLLETAHPLHAFDYDKLAENRIVVRVVKHSETIETIDGSRRVPPDGALVIADANRPVAVAGVMGGSESEVTSTTTKVFLESAAFDPRSIRKTSRSLGLITEASQRFQRGCDPEMAKYACDRAAYLMQEVAEGRVAEGCIDAYPGKVPSRTVSMRTSRCNMLIGNEIAPEMQRKYLERLGFTCTAAADGVQTFQVPTWRPDVAIEADLIEEVARLHGYGRIEPKMKAAGKQDVVLEPLYRLERRLREMLIGAGLTEFVNLSFTNPQVYEKAGITGEDANLVALENPLSENFSRMRRHLLPGLIENVERNVRFGVKSLAAFEIGPVYFPNDADTLPRQETHLAFVLYGDAEGHHWSKKPRKFDFYDAKGVVEAILAEIAADCRFEAFHDGAWQTGVCAELHRASDKTAFGRVGELSHAAIKRFDLPEPVFAGEICLELLLATDKTHPQFAELPKFPAVERDVAMLVDKSLAASALCDAARKAAGALCQRVEIFDVYVGDRLPAGKKSVAIRFVLQSPERTLTDAEVQKVYDKVVKSLNREFGAEQR